MITPNDARRPGGTRAFPRRAFLALAALAGFALTTPSAASAQSPTPERALLNRAAAVSAPLAGVAPASVDPRFPGGEQALLGRSSTATQSRHVPSADGKEPSSSRSPVDGAWALLYDRRLTSPK